MPRTGKRPHTWRVQGQPAHDQMLAWQRQSAQARYRGEPYLLTFEQFQTLWQLNWNQKGRASEQYCLHRQDPDLPWQLGNVECIRRIDYLSLRNDLRNKKR